LASNELSNEQIEVFGACLRAAASGPFFPDSEFETLIGLDREAVTAIAERWPHLDFGARDVVLALNNSIVNLLGYPHGCESAWSDRIPTTPERLRDLFSQWRRVSRCDDVDDSAAR
jgi:hypothetical protein